MPNYKDLQPHDRLHMLTLDRFSAGMTGYLRQITIYGNNYFKSLLSSMQQHPCRRITVFHKKASHGRLSKSNTDFEFQTPKKETMLISPTAYQQSSTQYPPKNMSDQTSSSKNSGSPAHRQTISSVNTCG